MDSEQPSDSIEIEDVESYRHEEEKFSHQQLVMRCIGKCIEALSVEPTEGKINTKRDKFGNLTTSYVPDTRRTAIETVKTTHDFMFCDLDDKAKNKINYLLQLLKDKKKYLLGEEYKWFESLPYDNKKQLILKHGGILKGSFNINFYFNNLYIDYQYNLYRRIFRELCNLTKRVGFYESQHFEN